MDSLVLRLLDEHAELLRLRASLRAPVPPGVTVPALPGSIEPSFGPTGEPSAVWRLPAGVEGTAATLARSGGRTGPTRVRSMSLSKDARKPDEKRR